MWKMLVVFALVLVYSTLTPLKAEAEFLETRSNCGDKRVRLFWNEGELTENQ
jgi:hypothetical protein